MEIIIKGEPKEIAAIVLEVQGQQSDCENNVFTKFGGDLTSGYILPIVQITNEAQEVLNQLMCDSGESASKIVSELITKFADAIEFQKVD